MTLIRRARVSLTGGGVVGGGVNTTYWSAALTAQTVRNRLNDFWTAISPIMTVDVQWAVEEEVETIEDSTGLIQGVAFGTGTLAGAGTSPGELLTFAAQGLLNLRTGVYVNGRELRGKIFIPGAPIPESENGRPGGNYFTVLSNAADNLVGTAGMRVFSPTHLTSAEVTAHDQYDGWAVLRSRRD